jgi:formylglycine-generating enzyme required for sulfatase activity
MEEFLADLQKAYPLSTNHNMVHRGNAQIGPKGPPVALSVPTPVITPRLSRKQSFRWARLAISVVLLLALALTFLLFKDPIVLLISSLTDTVATATGPSTLPTATASSPTIVPPASPTTAVAVTGSAVDLHPTLPPSATPPSPTVTPPTPTPQKIELRVWEADGAEMVFVPAGEFAMGSEELGDDERPVHRVYLDEFWIDRYEVTNGQFARFVASTGYQTEAEKRGWGWVWKGSEWEEIEGANWRHPRGPGSSIEGKVDHPVILTSWSDADAYCRWAGKRLPSEAQWEKAARGPFDPQQSGDPEHGQRYAWGNEFDSAKANTKESEQGDTTPVGNFSPQGDSPYGASDMTGNVWEWVADWYDSDYYSQSPSANPSGPVTGIYKILRGGSWLFDEVYARTPFRYNIRPDYTYDFAGFRCSSQ